MISGPFNFDQIKPINPLLSLFSTGAYGIEHAYRVFMIVDKICDFEEVYGIQRDILKFSSLFLEIGREENHVDTNYGVKSFQKIKQKAFFGKEVIKPNWVQFLMECHIYEPEEIEKKLGSYNIDDKSGAIVLMRILKDALSLDAFRFGNFCAADLEFSKSKKLVLFASQFCRKELKQDEITSEIEEWLKSVK